MRLLKNRNSGAMFLIFEGIVFTMVLNLYNPFIQMFAKRMGAQNIHIALLNAVPPLVAVFILIPCGILIERINRKKQTVLVLLFILSLFYAAIAFIPSIPHQSKVMAYVVLIGLLNWPGALYLTTWQSFFADHFKGSDANRVYSLRSKYSTLFGLLTVLVTGLLLTVIPKSDGERLFIYQIFYGACFVLTLLQLFFFSRIFIRDTSDPIQSDGAQELDTSGQLKAETGVACVTLKPSAVFDRSYIKGILSNKPFIIFCVCSFAFHLAWQMGWPLYFIYYADYAKLNEFQLGLVNVVYGFAQFLSYSIWSRLIHKRGSSLMIIFGAAGMAVSPFIFTTLWSFPVILLINILSGIFMAGFNLSLFCNLLETLPDGKKTVYISVFNTLTNIAGFIAPLIGIWIFNHTGIFLALGLVGVFRVCGMLLYAFRWWKARSLPEFKVEVAK
jgi:MFS family permease